MRSFVYLEILAADKDFTTMWKVAYERFLAGVDADVVDQFELSLERFETMWIASLMAEMITIASVVVNSNIVGRQVDHCLVERRKGSPTMGTERVIRIDPETALMTVKVDICTV